MLNRRLNGVGFARTRNVDTESPRPPEHRDRQRKRVARHVGKRRETAVIHLLVAARLIELDDLHELRVFKVGDGRIVKGDMTIFADAETDEVDRLFAEQFAIASTDGSWVRLLRGQRVKATDLHP